MELCGLTRGLVGWAKANGPALLPGIHGDQEKDSSKVLVCGGTVVDAVRIASCLDGLEGIGRLAQIDLLMPLGDANDLYRNCSGKEYQSGNAGTMLKGLMQDLRSVSPDVKGEVVSESIDDIPGGKYDLIIFGPLAFGLVESGVGAANFAARGEIIRRVVRKTKAVLCFVRDFIDWYHGIYGDSVIDEEDLGVALGDLHFIDFPLSSEIVLPNVDKEESLIKEFLGANALTCHCLTDREQFLGAKHIELAKRILRENQPLDERATLYFVTKDLVGGETIGTVGGSARGAKRNTSSVAPSSSSSSSEPKSNPYWPNGRDGEFFNVGLDLWTKQRAEWVKPKGEVEKRESAPIPYEEVIAGLASLRRTYELPQPIRLADLIDIYLDIWESQDGY